MLFDGVELCFGLALVNPAAYKSSFPVYQVIETDTQPSDLCTRREYARWLVSASSALSRYSFMILFFCFWSG